ncbi:MAG: hypothetical protein KKA79_06380 [Nanoarchaeota archaeon]|nr:hypothetical protein [Nanoarchaeota archaeon]
MISRDNDPLVDCLVELAIELDKSNIPIMIGGGLGLYLRQKFFSSRQTRYPFDVDIRSTADLDIFLTSSIIVDWQKITTLRSVIDQLGYKVLEQAKNFQFSKEISLYNQKRTIKIDLLAAPPQDVDMALVKISRPRIKPKGVKNIHAYLADESEGIELE